MDPFSKLPFPILVLIVKEAPDLLSLHSLICASPVMAGLLEGEGEGDGIAAEIVDSVISRTLCSPLQDVVRLAATMLRDPPSTWDHFLELAAEVELEAPLSRASRAFPTTSVRRLLALAKSVHGAAYRCAHVLLGRCSSLQLRRPVDLTFHLRHLHWWPTARGQSYTPMPAIPDEPVPVTPQPQEAPQILDWIEEQRLLKGAWQLAVFSLLRQSPGVGYGDVMQKPMVVWEELGESFRRYIFKGNMFLQTVADDGGLWEDEEGTPVSAKTYITRLADVAPTATSISPYSHSHSFIRGPNGNPANYPSLRNWGFSFVIKCRRERHSPLYLVSYAPFRSLGFYIWEKKRFVAMGCFADDETIRTRFRNRTDWCQSSYIYAWQSLLTPAERADVEERQRQYCYHKFIE